MQYFGGMSTFTTTQGHGWYFFFDKAMRADITVSTSAVSDWKAVDTAGNFSAVLSGQTLRGSQWGIEDGTFTVSSGTPFNASSGFTWIACADLTNGYIDADAEL